MQEQLYQKYLSKLSELDSIEISEWIADELKKKGKLLRKTPVYEIYQLKIGNDTYSLFISEYLEDGLLLKDRDGVLAEHLHLFDETIRLKVKNYIHRDTDKEPKMEFAKDKIIVYVGDKDKVSGKRIISPLWPLLFGYSFEFCCVVLKWNDKDDPEEARVLEIPISEYVRALWYFVEKFYSPKFSL